jgi:hypothetical protein
MKADLLLRMKKFADKRPVQKNRLADKEIENAPV